MATDVETACITSEFSSMASLSDIISSFESNSSSPHPSPESDSESTGNNDLKLSLPSRNPPPKRHSDDTDILDYNKPKRICTETNSSIRIALQKKGPPTGILRFFHKETEKERQEYLNCSSEEIKCHVEKFHTQELRHTRRKKNKERRQARE